MLQCIRRKKGITLVELVIAMAIFGLVLSIAFSLYFFAIKTFASGGNQSNVQSEIRLAADYMTKELRNAYKIEILTSLPSPMDPEKRYFYVEDNKIKHFFEGVEKDVLHFSSPDFIPNLTFRKNTIDPEKVLSYSIFGTYKGNDFDIVSEVYPVNSVNSDDIVGPSSGIAVAYSSPLTDLETVNVDRLLLELSGHNLMLAEDGSGHLVLNPPIPNVLRLVLNGKNGSVITWSSDDPSTIDSNGNVNRPDAGGSPKTVELTATLARGEASANKSFTVKVMPFLPLEIDLTGIAPEVALTIGNSFTYQFTAEGGTGSYTYTMEPLLPEDTYQLADHGLTLGDDGKLTGVITGDPGTFVYKFTLSDGNHSDIEEIITFIIGN
ncbi:MAG: immunoglobulin-like domain-containing protein [Caldicoprobacterales bacterium]|jgi:prepilin-type N-terminal cleavage/methylation domain-containing protein